MQLFLRDIDIVRVHNKQFIPADLILLASSEPQGMCYIEVCGQLILFGTYVVSFFLLLANIRPQALMGKYNCRL